MQPTCNTISDTALNQSEENRLAEDLLKFQANAIKVSGARYVLEKKLGMEMPDANIAALFGGIKGSQIQIAADGSNADVWTSNEWFETPLYFSVERDEIGIILTINDFFLKENAPRTLGTRMVATMVFQAAKIPKFDSIRASATRFYVLKDSGSIREAIGYYFFPRLGFNGDPKKADDYVEIPKAIKGKKLISIMQDAELRDWWQANGQTIEVRFKIRSKRSLQALCAYLQEKRIEISK
jgi:hypothetical protein